MLRRHLRCPDCGYDLFLQPTRGICPECGSAYTRRSILLFLAKAKARERIAPAKVIVTYACIFLSVFPAAVLGALVARQGNAAIIGATFPVILVAGFLTATLRWTTLKVSAVTVVPIVATIVGIMLHFMGYTPFDLEAYDSILFEDLAFLSALIFVPWFLGVAAGQYAAHWLRAKRRNH